MDNTPTPDSLPTQQPAGHKKRAYIIWASVIVIILLCIGALLYAKIRTAKSPASSSQAGSNNQQTPAVLGQTTAAQDQNSADGSEKTFTIDGGEFYFKPNEITVNKGDKVKIIFNNSGGYHDFVIDEFNVRTPRIQGGQTTTVEFVADKTGSFYYYCSVGEHRARGMQGTLIVQ